LHEEEFCFIITPDIKIFLEVERMNLSLKTKILKSQCPQIAIAHDVGIPEPYLSKIVNGWIDPKPEIKKKIAKALKCPVEEIFPTKEPVA
jgi:DNA-binding XRE family transcriptional regulator